jgi:hypothetical protein
MVALARAEAPDIELLQSPWESALSGLLSSSEQFLLIASPFITRPVAQWVGDHLAKSSTVQSLPN